MIEALQEIDVADDDPVAAEQIPLALTAGNFVYDDGATTYVEHGRETRGRWHVDDKGRFCSFWRRATRRVTTSDGSWRVGTSSACAAPSCREARISTVGIGEGTQRQVIAGQHLLTLERTSAAPASTAGATSAARLSSLRRDRPSKPVRAVVASGSILRKAPESGPAYLSSTYERASRADCVPESCGHDWTALQVSLTVQS
jgi:hypothetical protein